MKKPLSLSVVIPVYNEEAYIGPCLKALMNQEHRIDEIIVVDNNSTDKTKQIVKKTYPGVKIIEEKEQGIVFARNTGFEASSSDIIAKIDADTCVLPSWSGEILTDFIERAIDGWSGYVSSNEGNKLFRSISRYAFNFLTFKTVPFVAGHPMLFGANMAVSKKSWEVVVKKLHMRNDIWEDLDTASAYNLRGLTIINKKNVTAHITLRSANTTPRRFYRRLYGAVYAILPYSKPRAVYMFLLIHLFFIVWIVLTPITIFGQHVGKRPRPEQY